MKFLSLPLLLLLVLLAGRPAGAADPYTDTDLFDPQVLHELRLYVSPTDWQTLKDNYLENTYYPAQLVWRGMSVDNVGIRSRGRMTRNPVKPCLRIDFNRFVDDQKFLGLSSLVLDNAWQDPSFTREAMVMSIYRKLGFAAPRESFARLYINDKYAGLYVIVEDVVKKFLKRNYNENDGWLYEYHWTTQYYFEYLGADPALYGPAMFEPVTHDDAPDYTALVAMIRTINEASDDDFASRAGEYLNLKKFAAYLAVENYVAEWDGILGTAGLNNFYIYQLKATKKFEFIPWDEDLTFQVNEFPIMTRIEDNVLTRRMMQIPEVKEAYLSTLAQLAADINGPGCWLAQDLENYYSLIRSSVQEDTVKHFTDAEFEQEINWQRFFIGYRPAYVLDQIRKVRAQQSSRLVDRQSPSHPCDAGTLGCVGR